MLIRGIIMEITNWEEGQNFVFPGDYQYKIRFDLGDGSGEQEVDGISVSRDSVQDYAFPSQPDATPTDIGQLAPPAVPHRVGRKVILDVVDNGGVVEVELISNEDYLVKMCEDTDGQA